MMHPVWLKPMSMGLPVFVLSAAADRLDVYDQYLRAMCGRIATEVMSC